MLSKIVYLLSVIKSYIFCFRYLTFSEAKKCPILIHWRVKTFISRTASIKIKDGSKHSVKIGIWAGSYGISRGKVTQFSILDKAQVIFNGQCNISKGCNVVARGNAVLSFGKHFFCNANCKILANKSISFGNDILMGWNVTMLDGDGHRTLFNEQKQDDCKEIFIADHCWIGADSTILKGVKLDKNTIVPYGSIIHKSTNGQTNTVFSNKVLKENMEWID